MINGNAIGPGEAHRQVRPQEVAPVGGVPFLPGPARLAMLRSGGGETMSKRFAAGLAVLGLALAVPAIAQQPLKIGLIMTYTGQFADAATQMDNGIKLYVQGARRHVAGRKIEFIRRDSGGVPDNARRHAQELVCATRSTSSPAS